MKKYGTLVCCGCKLAMLAEAILFCREHGIRELADGFRREQIYYPEQTAEYMVPAGRLAQSFKVRYVHPLYEAKDADVHRMAAEEGLPPVALQPSCLFAFNRIQPSAKNPEVRQRQVARGSGVYPEATRFAEVTRQSRRDTGGTPRLQVLRPEGVGEQFVERGNPDLADLLFFVQVDAQYGDVRPGRNSRIFCRQRPQGMAQPVLAWTATAIFFRRSTPDRTIALMAPISACVVSV